MSFSTADDKKILCLDICQRSAVCILGITSGCRCVCVYACMCVYQLSLGYYVKIHRQGNFSFSSFHVLNIQSVNAVLLKYVLSNVLRCACVCIAANANKYTQHNEQRAYIHRTFHRMNGWKRKDEKGKQWVCEHWTLLLHLFDTFFTSSETEKAGMIPSERHEWFEGAERLFLKESSLFFIVSNLQFCFILQFLFAKHFMRRPKSNGIYDPEENFHTKEYFYVFRTEFILLKQQDSDISFCIYIIDSTKNQLRVKRHRK